MGTVSNEELIRKAVITTDALAAAGKLNPAQSDAFIDYVIQETVLKDNARVVRFRNETLEIDKIGIGKRAAVPKAEAAAPSVRRGITTSKITLQPKEIMVPFEIGDNFKEINIEGDNVEDHIVRMMATQMANDMEELYINGDTVGPSATEGDIVDGGSTTKVIKDTFLAMFDGWMRKGDGAHVVDGEGASIGLSIFGKMLRAMPNKFRRNKGDLRFFMSPDLYQLYCEKLATRATMLGDEAAGGGMHKPFGVTPVEVPLLDLNPQVVEHVTLNGTTAVNLRFAPYSAEVVAPSTLAGTAVDPYIKDSDYTVDYTAGTIARKAGGAISDGQVVKVTYKANPQILLTHYNNFIVGIGRDIRIEKDRDIFKGTNQYAITAKISVEFEELDAIVKAKNVGTGI